MYSRISKVTDDPIDDRYCSWGKSYEIYRLSWFEDHSNSDEWPRIWITI